MRIKRGRRQQAGFSLLEILVAFAIMALALGVLLRIFGGGTRTAQTVDDYARAIAIAESLLAATGVETPLEEGETAGDADEHFHWQRSITPYPIAEELLTVAGTLAAPVQPPAVSAYRVELTVTWGADDDHRAFTLQTLRTLQSPPIRHVPFR